MLRAPFLWLAALVAWGGTPGTCSNPFRSSPPPGFSPAIALGIAFRDALAAEGNATGLRPPFGAEGGIWLAIGVNSSAAGGSELVSAGTVAGFQAYGVEPPRGGRCWETERLSHRDGVSARRPLDDVSVWDTSGERVMVDDWTLGGWVPPMPEADVVVLTPMALRCAARSNSLASLWSGVSRLRPHVVIAHFPVLEEEASASLVGEWESVALGRSPRGGLSGERLLEALEAGAPSETGHASLEHWIQRARDTGGMEVDWTLSARLRGAVMWGSTLGGGDVGAMAEALRGFAGGALGGAAPAGVRRVAPQYWTAVSGMLVLRWDPLSPLHRRFRLPATVPWEEDADVGPSEEELLVAGRLAVRDAEWSVGALEWFEADATSSSVTLAAAEVIAAAMEGVNDAASLSRDSLERAVRVGATLPGEFAEYSRRAIRYAGATFTRVLGDGTRAARGRAELIDAELRRRANVSDAPSLRPWDPPSDESLIDLYVADRRSNGSAALDAMLAVWEALDADGGRSALESELKNASLCRMVGMTVFLLTRDDLFIGEVSRALRWIRASFRVAQAARVCQSGARMFVINGSLAFGSEDVGGASLVGGGDCRSGVGFGVEASLRRLSSHPRAIAQSLALASPYADVSVPQGQLYPERSLLARAWHKVATDLAVAGGHAHLGFAHRLSETWLGMMGLRAERLAEAVRGGDAVSLTRWAPEAIGIDADAAFLAAYLHPAAEPWLRRVAAGRAIVELGMSVQDALPEGVPVGVRPLKQSDDESRLVRLLVVCSQWRDGHSVHRNMARGLAGMVGLENTTYGPVGDVGPSRVRATLVVLQGVGQPDSLGGYDGSGFAEVWLVPSNYSSDRMGVLGRWLRGGGSVGPESPRSGCRRRPLGGWRPVLEGRDAEWRSPDGCDGWEWRFDAVFFPQLGMHPFDVALASMRLGPVQFTTYGHPSSSRIPAMDFFVVGWDAETGVMVNGQDGWSVGPEGVPQYEFEGRDAARIAAEAIGTVPSSVPWMASLTAGDAVGWRFRPNGRALDCTDSGTAQTVQRLVSKLGSDVGRLLEAATIVPALEDDREAESGELSLKCLRRPLYAGDAAVVSQALGEGDGAPEEIVDRARRMVARYSERVLVMDGLGVSFEAIRRFHRPSAGVAPEGGGVKVEVHDDGAVTEEPAGGGMVVNLAWTVVKVNVDHLGSLFEALRVSVAGGAGAGRRVWVAESGDAESDGPGVRGDHHSRAACPRRVARRRGFWNDGRSFAACASGGRSGPAVSLVPAVAQPGHDRR
jgi:hypothetical protein